VSGKEFDQPTLIKITNTCSGNPLALKLVIDRFNLGYSIEDSKSVALSEILKFSFGSLINTLEINEKKVLESIFISDTASRHMVAELTKLNSDNIAEVISRLQKTSLIERSQNETGETYKISSSVRDLLASSPLSYEYRSDYATAFSQFRLKENTLLKDELINVSYFEPKTPKEFQRNYKQIPKLWSKHFRSNLRMDMPETVRNSFSVIDTTLTSTETEFKKYADYYRIRAQSRSLLQDIRGALDYAKKAYDISPDSLPVAHTLSILYLANQNNNLASDSLRPFIVQFLASIERNEALNQIFDEYILRDSFSTFFKATTWSDGGKEVVEITKIWKSVPIYLQGAFVYSRAMALRRMHESSRAESIERQKDLIEATKLVKFALTELDLKPKFLKNEVSNIYKEIYYTIENNFIAPGFEEEITKAYQSLNYLLRLVEETYHGDENKTNAIVKETISIDKEIPSKLKVDVYLTKPTYVYARDKDGNSYFVPLSSFNSKLPLSLRVGQKIWIWGYQSNEIKNNLKKADFATV
jgi:hypothetical protein